MLNNFILSTLIDLGQTLTLVCDDIYSNATKSCFNFDDYYEVIIDYEQYLVSIPKYSTLYDFSVLEDIGEIEFLSNLIYSDLRSIEQSLLSL